MALVRRQRIALITLAVALPLAVAGWILVSPELVAILGALAIIVGSLIEHVRGGRRRPGADTGGEDLGRGDAGGGG